MVILDVVTLRCDLSFFFPCEMDSQRERSGRKFASSSCFLIISTGCSGERNVDVKTVVDVP